MMQHAPKPRCDICGKELSNKYKLKRHVDETHSDKKVQCSDCLNWYSGSSLYIHLKKYCKGKSREVMPNQEREKLANSKGLITSQLRQPNEGIQEQFHCKVCNQSFLYTEGAIEKHAKLHSPPYNCGVCQKGFYKSGHLKQHQIVHSDEKPYKCSFCSKSFKSKQPKINHERFHHNGEKPYECEICHCRFSYSSARNSHARNVHKNIE